MNLKAYVKPLIDYWWLIVAAAVIAIGTTYVVTSSQPDVYQTRTTLVVGNMMYETNPSGNDIYLGQQLANYYATIGMQGEVRNSTEEALGMNWLPRYTIYPVPNSQLIEIVVNDTIPARAQAVANELARQLIAYSPTSNEQQDTDQQSFVAEQVTYLEDSISETLLEIEVAERNLSETNSAQKIAEIQTEITALQAKLAQQQSNYAALLANTQQGAINVLSVIEPAALPTSAVGPGRTTMLLIAGAVAAAIAATAAYILEFLDDTIKTPTQITKHLGLPVIGSIPKLKGKLESKTPLQTVLSGFTSENGDFSGSDSGTGKFINSPAFLQQPVVEDFRLLRMSLIHANHGQLPRSILITSPSPSEGKSLLASNLAMAMAQSGKKVVLINARFHDETETEGLGEVLVGKVDLSAVMQRMDDNLGYLDAGNKPSNIVGIYSMPRVKDVFQKLRKGADVVVIDGPPLTSAEAFELSALVEGVMVVLRYGHTRRGTAAKQCEKLDQVGANVIGAILNNIPA